MKKIVILLIVVIVIGTMTVTCPDKEAHVTALNNEWTTYIDKTRMENDAEQKLEDPFEKGLSMLLYSAAGSIVKAMFEQQLVVKNNFVYSVGEINSEEGTKTVSVGVLGHVFVFLDADKIKESLKE